MLQAPTALRVARDASGGVARGPRRRAAGLVLAAVVLALVVLASIAIGARAISPLEVLRILLGSETGHGQAVVVVRDLRLPRTLVGLVVGAGLGVGGALIQAATRNPLADPGILGVNAGAAFAVAVGIAVFGTVSIAGYVWFALAGALLATLAVFLIGNVGRASSPVRLLLAGVALAAVLTGITNAISQIDPDAFAALLNWEAGSIADRDTPALLPVLPVLGAGLVLAALAARPLNALALGEDAAAALGVRVAGIRILVVVAITLLAGGATALAGPIAFVGLMVPHVARWIAGADQRWILAYCLVLGPVLVLAADVLGRVVVPPGELPVGIVTAFVGAPVLIVLVRRRRVSTP
jgi:iron complex transport system permease protein